jgi:hypothetical protein
VEFESSIKCSDTEEDNPIRPQQQVRFEEHSAGGNGNGMVGEIEPFQKRAFSLHGGDSEFFLTEALQQFILEEISPDNNPSAIDEENGIPDFESPIKSSSMTDEAYPNRSQQNSLAEDTTSGSNNKIDVTFDEPISEKPVFSLNNLKEDAASSIEHPQGIQRVRRRLKPGLSGFIPNSFSKYFASTHPINEMTYDGGSVKHIRLRRDDLNFQVNTETERKENRNRKNLRY